MREFDFDFDFCLRNRINNDPPPQLTNKYELTLHLRKDIAFDLLKVAVV